MLRVVGAVVVIWLPVWVAQPAAADIGGSPNCVNGAHASSTACANGFLGETYYGASVTFPSMNMVLDAAHTASGDHINHEQWLYTRTDETQWVETGVRLGKWPDCNCGAYVVFWADWDVNGFEHPHLIAYAQPDHSVHQYFAYRDGTTGNWWVAFDGVNVGYSTVLHSTTAYEAQDGMEVSAAPGSAGSWSGSDLFDDTNNSLLTGSGWTSRIYQNQWTDQPCGSWAFGQCFQGIRVPNTEFKSSKS